MSPALTGAGEGFGVAAPTLSNRLTTLFITNEVLVSLCAPRFPVQQSVSPPYLLHYLHPKGLGGRVAGT